jgi:hypothetical protein
MYSFSVDELGAYAGSLLAKWLYIDLKQSPGTDAVTFHFLIIFK